MTTTPTEPVDLDIPRPIRFPHLGKVVTKLGKLKLPCAEHKGVALVLQARDGILNHAYPRDVAVVGFMTRNGQKFSVFRLMKPDFRLVADKHVNRARFSLAERSEAYGLMSRLEAEGYGRLQENVRAVGKNTGVCCICGAVLTDPVSVEAGIGPVCGSRLNHVINPSFNLDALLGKEPD